MTKLYEMTQAYNQLFELIESDDYDLDTLEDTIQAVEGSIEVKVENIAKMIRTWEGQSAIMQEEEKRIRSSRQALENRIDAIKDYLLISLSDMGKDKITTSIGTVSRQKSPPSIQVLDLEAIPEQYIVIPPVEPKADKKALIELYKTTGMIYPGTSVHQGYHLRIR